MRIQQPYIKVLFIVILLFLLPCRMWGNYYAGVKTKAIYKDEPGKGGYGEGLVYVTTNGSPSGDDSDWWGTSTTKEYDGSNYTGTKSGKVTINLFAKTTTNTDGYFLGWTETEGGKIIEGSNKQADGKTYYKYAAGFTAASEDGAGNALIYNRYAVFSAYYAKAVAIVASNKVRNGEGCVYVTAPNPSSTPKLTAQSDETGDGNYKTSEAGGNIEFGYFAKPKDGSKFLGWSIGSEDADIENDSDNEYENKIYKWIHAFPAAEDYALNGDLKQRVHTAYAHFTKLFKITYAGYGAPSDVTEYWKECNLSLPTPAARTGYTFIGWKASNVSESGKGFENDKLYPAGTTSLNGKECDVTMTAEWEAIPGRISYDFAGGSPNPGYTEDYTIEDAITLPVVTKDESDFKGWIVSGSDHNWPESKIEAGTTGFPAGERYGDVTLTADWNTKEYNVSYELDGGKNPDDTPTTFTKAVGITLPSPTKTAYDFVEWEVTSESAGGWTKGTKYKAGDHPSGNNANVTFTAHWTPTTYTINLEAGIDGSVTPKSIDYDIEKDFVTIPTSTKQGCDFTGWKITESVPEGGWTDDIIQPGDLTVKGRYGDVTLTAQWLGGVIIKVNWTKEEESCAVAFKVSEKGGSSSFTVSIPSGGAAKLKNLEKGKTYTISPSNWDTGYLSFDAASKDVEVSGEEKTITFTASKKSDRKTYETFREF